jgi:dihydrofolate reductase
MLHMPTRVVYYAAMSLDGRIAGRDHDLSFLQMLERGPEDDYTSFYDSLDSLVMGAGTWDFIVRHGSWPYAAKPTWVVTHREELEPVEGAVVEAYAGDLAELVRRIGDRGYERTWLIGGGDLAGQLLEADLLEELIVTVAPTLVGRGPALADGEFPLPQFSLAEVSPWGENGARLRYER